MSKIFSFKTLVLSAVILSMLIAFSGTASAKTNGEIRAGWGFGDNNHIHIGPPGQSVFPVDTLVKNERQDFEVYRQKLLSFIANFRSLFGNHS